MVTIVNNIVLHITEIILKFSQRVNLKNSHQMKKICKYMW